MVSQDDEWRISLDRGCLIRPAKSGDIWNDFCCHTRVWSSTLFPAICGPKRVYTGVLLK